MFGLKFVIFIQVCLVTTKASEGALWSDSTQNLRESFFGEGVEDFEVVHPVRLDEDGMFLSSDVRYVTPPHDVKASRRRRRHADFDTLHSRSSRLLYKVPFGSQIITLNLTANEQLVRDDFVIERIKAANGTARAGLASSLSRGTQWPCHFRGHVTGQPDSRVALSTCHGLTGLIITKNGDYFIEPLTIARVRTDPIERGQKAQPHKIYRRDLASVLDKAEPLLKLRKAVKESQEKEDGGRLDSAEDETFTAELDEHSVFGDSHEFCGVRDTRRKYRRIIKKREQWEAKRERLDGDERWKHSSESRRRKRSVSVERMIEMLVVVDKKMVDYYEAEDEGNVERYVLTIINMVSELFHDASIGNSLHISLVRLILLEEEEEGLKISQHAENTLDSFCKWAKKINPKGDDHPNHHDVAVLLTRRDICSNSNKSCETLGLAHVAGMCQSHRSCNVNQDTGLSLAFTVAHELGHNFAMHHDGQLNDCKPTSAKYNNIMAPHLTSSSLAMRWSSCSRRYITRFLDRNWGFCLNDEPADHEEFEMPESLAGVVYDADHQCRLMFGDKSRHCYGIDDVCHRLWCYVGGTCRSRMHAAAPGTNCGQGKWCYRGKCSPVGKRQETVDGGWGVWTEWSACSRTCGMGVSYSMRHCDNPTPRNGGQYCLGERKRYKTCSKWKCRASNDTRNFRQQQCAAFNNVKYRNRTFEWTPVDSPLYPCELHCYTHAGKIPFADRLRDKVVDGTKCFPGSNDICVDGICRRVGCDKNIGSRALEDRCGVCHGDDSSCYGVKKIFSRKKGEEYAPVALLPRGARNIDIEEVSPASNFLALRHATNKTHYYLNGNYMIQWDTKFQLAGTQFTYRRLNETRDVISSPGPLIHPMMVMILYVEENPGIEVTYTAPYDDNLAFPKEEEFPEFTWKIRNWSECTQKCGKGHQISAAYCDEKTAGHVEDFFCNATLRPEDKRRPCNDIPCPPRWWTAPWQPCSVTCGAAVGVQHRTVMCVRSVGEGDQIELNQTECSNSNRPSIKRRCSPASEIPCPKWRAEDWRECSASCGGGVTSRTVQCVTYIMNDVIDLGDIDEDLLDIGSPERPRRKKQQHQDSTPAPDNDFVETSNPKLIIPKLRGSKNSNALLGVEQVLTGMGLMLSIEVDPIRYELDNELDGYDVEEVDMCDNENKPHSHKECNTFTCPVITSPEIETEPAISTEVFTTRDVLNQTTRLPTTNEGQRATTQQRQTPSEAPEKVTNASNPSTAAISAGSHGSSPPPNVPVGLRNINIAVTDEKSESDSEYTPGPITTDITLEEFLAEGDETPPPETEYEMYGMHSGYFPGGYEEEELPVTVTEWYIPNEISTPENSIQSRPTTLGAENPDSIGGDEAKKILDNPILDDDIITSEDVIAVTSESDDVIIPALGKTTESTQNVAISAEETVKVGEDDDIESPGHVEPTEPSEMGKDGTSKDDSISVLVVDEFDIDGNEEVPPTIEVDPQDGNTNPRPTEGSQKEDTETEPTPDPYFDVFDEERGRISPKIQNLPRSKPGSNFDVEEDEGRSSTFPNPSSSHQAPSTAMTSPPTTHRTSTRLRSDLHRIPHTPTRPRTPSRPSPTRRVHVSSHPTTSIATTSTRSTTTTSRPTTTTTSQPTTTTTTTTTTLPATTTMPTTTTSTTQSTTTEHKLATTVQADWIVGNWSECSTTCGVGAVVRRVQCSGGEDRLCEDTEKPPPAQRCNLGPCAKWVYGEWKKCSALCGVGSREKKTECVEERTGKVLRPHNCRALPTLTTVRISCRGESCMPWKTSRWTSCSKICGPGIQRRRTACSRYGQCDPALKPVDKKSCFLRKCVQWKAMEWGKCSVHCGGGVQRRNVICTEKATGLTTDATLCVANLRPKRLRRCNMHQCPAADYDFAACDSDRLSKRFCGLLRTIGRCVQPSLAIQCCVTCKTYANVRLDDKIS